MSDVIETGDIGTRWDITVRQGDTLGPYSIALTDEAGTAINLTGATVEAFYGAADDPLTITMDPDRTTGQFSLELAAAAVDALGGADFWSAARVVAWRMVITWADTSVQTLYYGVIAAASSATPA